MYRAVVSQDEVTPVLVVLTDSDHFSEKIFEHSMWGVRMIIPTFSRNRVDVRQRPAAIDEDTNRYLEPFYAKISEILVDLKKSHRHVLLLQVDIVEMNYFEIDAYKFAADAIVAPIVKNLEVSGDFSKVNLNNTNLGLIEEFAKPKEGIHGVRVGLEGNAFKIDPSEPDRNPTAVRVFEESLSLAHTFCQLLP